MLVTVRKGARAQSLVIPRPAPLLFREKPARWAQCPRDWRTVRCNSSFTAVCGKRRPAAPAEATRRRASTQLPQCTPLLHVHACTQFSRTHTHSPTSYSQGHRTVSPLQLLVHIFLQITSHRLYKVAKNKSKPVRSNTSLYSLFLSTHRFCHCFLCNYLAPRKDKRLCGRHGDETQCITLQLALTWPLPVFPLSPLYRSTGLKGVGEFHTESARTGWTGLRRALQTEAFFQRQRGRLNV